MRLVDLNDNKEYGVFVSGLPEADLRKKIVAASGHVDGASGGALARLAGGLHSRPTAHIIPISANGPIQHSPAQSNPVGMAALP